LELLAVVSSKNEQPIVIPHTELSADALRGVLESFVLREGTDYGEREFSLDEKVAHVLRQLERGEAQVIFDAELESVDIVVRKPNPQRTGET
jgi:uncharacterized protein